MKTYFDDGTLTIRSMMPGDAKILYDTYLSYGWHPQIKTYEDYYKEQEEGERLVFIAEYEGAVKNYLETVLHLDKDSLKKIIPKALEYASHTSAYEITESMSTSLL